MEDHLEELERVYDEKFSSTYGPMHPRVKKLFEDFCRCGDLHFGFLRLRCPQCGAEKLLPHSCKTRGLCPSCGTRRAIQWAERMVEEVLPDTDYQQIIFTLPKILRKAFLFKRSLVGELCRAAYAAIKQFFQEHFPNLKDPVPAVIIAPQSFGSLVNANLHLHALCSLGVYDRQGRFHPAAITDFSPLLKLFQELTFKMLLKEEAVTAERVALIRSWNHSGFNLETSRRVAAGDRQGLEILLRYMERPPISLSRLTYRDDGMVHYQGARFHPGLGRDHQLVTGLEFLAMLVPHIALRYEVTIRAYGALSTTIRKKFGWIKSSDNAAPTNVPLIDGEESGFVKVRKRNWAKLITKIWLEDPEVCSQCGSQMVVLAAISSPAQDEVIEKILKHLHRWDPPWRQGRRKRGPPNSQTTPVSMAVVVDWDIDMDPPHPEDD